MSRVLPLMPGSSDGGDDGETVIHGDRKTGDGAEELRNSHGLSSLLPRQHKGSRDHPQTHEVFSW